MSRQYREPGNAYVDDRFLKKNGEDTQLKKSLVEKGADLRKYKRWRTRWVSPEGKPKTKDFMKKGDAQRFADETNSAILRGEYIDARAGRATILSLYEEWEPTTVIAESTRYRRKSCWRNHLLERWGDHTVSSIKKPDIQAWITESHRNGKSAATLQQALAILRLIFGHAVETGRILANPATGVKIPREKPNERYFLTAPQVKTLAENIDGHYSTLILTLSLVGLRFNEAAALRVKDIDFQRSRIEVRRAFSDVGGKLIEGPTKTSEERSVAFPLALLEGLEESVEHKDPDDLVFTTLEGHVLRKDNFRRRHFYPAREKAGDALGSPFPPVTLHDLRHTAATLAISSGANVKAIQGMLGHATTEMTTNRYGHLFESDVDSVALKVNSLFLSA